MKLLISVFALCSLQVHATPLRQHFEKVVIVVFENTNYQNAIKQPDFANLQQLGATLTNMRASTHPSQGNYVAMIAGSTLGIRDNSPVNLSQNHIGDLLEAAGLHWRVYAEDYPGNCFLDKKVGLYVRKHVPFLSFTNVTQNPSRCAMVQSHSSFEQDVKSGNLPEFSMYIPNMKNSGHDTNVNYSGKWLTTKFSSILTNPVLLSNTLFIFTFDESGGSPVNQIYTVLVGKHVIPGMINTQPMTHSALLKMIEDEFGLGTLGREDQSAPTLNGIWN